MAIDENNKKKPSRGERYRNLYDAYRDETESEEDDFWSTLNGPVQEASGSSGRKPEPEDVDDEDVDDEDIDIDDEDDDDDLADPEEILAAKARAAKRASAGTARGAAAGVYRSAQANARTARSAAARTARNAGASARSTRSAGDASEREVTAPRRKVNRKKREQERKLKRGRRMFIVFLVLWSLVLIGGGIWLWRYTGRCLVEYEASQPENNAERLLQEFVTKVRNGSIEGEFKEFSDSEDWKLPGVFESATLIKEQYI
ncbi:MAG: hypothetical protein IK055_04245, partial [Lachnospiraceae bacterium]|nr:hypothetical protein [Lachnospiraceae bacterium]